MKKVSLSKLMHGVLAKKSDPPAVVWQPVDQPYPRLTGFNAAALIGRAGIYAVWHLGVRPQWLRVGASGNLAAAITALAYAKWTTVHRNNAGVFVAWAYPPQNQCIAMVGFLAEKLKPAFQDEPFPDDWAVDPAVAPIGCPLPPGTR